MIVELPHNDWYIESEPLSWMLKKRRVAKKGKKKGETVSKVIGYYANLPMALRAAAGHILRHATGTVDLDGAVSKVREVEGYCEAALKTAIALHGDEIGGLEELIQRNRSKPIRSR